MAKGKELFALFDLIADEYTKAVWNLPKNAGATQSMKDKFRKNLYVEGGITLNDAVRR